MGITPALLRSGRYRRGVVRRPTTKSSNRNPPWLMLRPSFDYDAECLMSHRFYRPEKGKEIVTLEAVGPDTTAYGQPCLPNYVGSSHGWLASYDRQTRNIFLSNPVRRQFRFLPTVGVTPQLGQDVHRVAFSSPPNDIYCRALMIYGPKHRLAVGLPGSSCHWTSVYYGRDLRHESVAYSNKRGTFFCITRDGQGSHALISVDLSKPGSPKVEWIMDPLPRLNDPNYEEDECLNINYLVFHEDSDQLYVVVRRALTRVISNPSSPLYGSFNIRNPHYTDSRGGIDYPHKTVGFGVYKVDIEGKKASYCRSSLDGLALFVGINQPVAVRVTPEMTTSLLQPDSIYFTDLPEFVVGLYSSHVIGDNGVFNYQTKTFSTFLHDYPIDIRSCCLRKMLSTPLPLWYTPWD